MTGNGLLTIGQLSALCNISAKTLRYYDEIGLLAPQSVDAANNYRYYSREQIVRLNVIKHFRSSGFSLEDVRLLLAREDLALLERKLGEKSRQTARKIRELTYIHRKIENDIQNLRMGKEFSDHLASDGPDGNSHGIEHRDIPAVQVLFTRYRCASDPETYVRRYSELAVLMEKYRLYRVGPMMAVYHDWYEDFDYGNADIEVCVPVAGSAPQCPHLREYGNFPAVTILHKGAYDKTPESYAVALKWIAENGLTYLGPATEKYIIDNTSTGLEENYVTELILPVKKAESAP